MSAMYRPAMPPKPIPPALDLGIFTCPHCAAVAHMTWRPHVFLPKELPVSKSARCAACEKNSIWVADRMVYPDHSMAPEPNPDMPDSVRELYDEAAGVSGRSARSAAALLRLAIDVLCDELGCTKTRLDDKIGELVARGLPDRMTVPLDVVRVTGNAAVHDASLILGSDDAPTVSVLFGLINQIVDVMVTQPAATDALLEQMPTGAREAMERRNDRAAGGNGGNGG